MKTIIGKNVPVIINKTKEEKSMEKKVKEKIQIPEGFFSFLPGLSRSPGHLLNWE